MDPPHLSRTTRIKGNSRQGITSRTQAALAELGADPALLSARQLPLHAEAPRLQCVGLGTDGRDKFLLPAAARAWLGMRDAAAADGVELLLVSAFRSFDFQLALIRGKLARGRTLDDVLSVNAPPGCSEHHSGRAVDIGSRDHPPLEEDFERSAAFAWLQQHAAGHGYSLSFPRGNRYGYLYEPWHWCWHRDIQEKEIAVMPSRQFAGRQFAGS